MKVFNKFKVKVGSPSFIVKSIIFLLVLFTLDLSIGSLLNYLYFKQDSGLLYRTTYSLDSTKADFLIFGSSTANHHYDPSIFEKRMHMSVYNTGRDANTIFYNYAVFQSIIKRYTPKIAILDFNVGEFKVFPQNYDRLSSLLPYYKTNPELDQIIQLKSPFEKLKLISKIYPFNSLLFTILIGNTGFNKSRDYISDEKGYIPLDRILKRKITIDTSGGNYKIDSTKIRLLKSFVRECKNYDIQLYICISPCFKKYYYPDPSVIVINKIANELNVPFYNFSDDTLFWDHPEYFADEVHLNETGAKIFSNKVVDKIKENQKQKPINSQQTLSVEVK
ncbi:hypothetical protein EFY79_08855 [Hanamia caeni]|jgi:hypothetical protein|uniref:Uncharacterized protein n=1 Tax=Hanamia caeni TaxID=2294116 RepID=A0A3M9NJX9_9BACT|nr:hypothetical protein [Hanamia caeni]RNI37493.1 hypothetical protein EFY79_08855 [Hanamia caeni]